MTEIPEEVYMAAHYDLVLTAALKILERYSHDEGLTRAQMIVAVTAYQDLYVRLTGAPSELLAEELRKAKKGY